MSQMFFRTEEGKISIYREDKTPESLESRNPEKREKQEPHKGTGRSNYRAYDIKTLRPLVESQKRETAIELGEDPTLWSCGFHWTRLQYIQKRRARAPISSERRENGKTRWKINECMPTKWRNMDPSTTS